MKVFTDITSLQNFLLPKRRQGLQVGLVPTMGALHQGHLSLIRQAKSENDLTVCSIYINPTQFNNAGDLEKYPRTLELDLALLSTQGCEVVFAPTDHTMYVGNQLIRLDFGYLTQIMEGRYRQGHFSGVGLVVAKLLNIIKPNRAYFGQKDIQQFFIIRQLVRELAFDVELTCHPTVREPSGLAMSSRNQRLSESEREKAVGLFQALALCESALKNGESWKMAHQRAVEWIETEGGIRLEYLELADGDTLEILTEWNQNKQAVLCIAAFVGEVRLIDNVILF
jgi:pantoate--beta-alanine ligase